MYIKKDLQTLIDNMDETQVKVLSEVAVRMSAASAGKWTGKLAFAMNISQGTFGDTHVTMDEILRRH